MNFKELNNNQQQNLCYVSLLEDHHLQCFYNKLSNYNLLYKREIYSTLEQLGSVAYNTLLSILDNEQLFSLFIIPDSQYRWILVDKHGHIVRKSKRTFSSLNECQQKGLWISKLYSEHSMLVE
jgi:hypothetical protein